MELAPLIPFVMLEENWKICDSPCAEKKTDMKETKKSNMVISPKDTRRLPYQYPRAMNQYSADCVRANHPIVLRSGFTELAIA